MFDFYADEEEVDFADDDVFEVVSTPRHTEEQGQSSDLAMQRGFRRMR